LRVGVSTQSSPAEASAMTRKRIPFNQIRLGLRRSFILTACWCEGATVSIQLLEAREEEPRGIRKFRFGSGQQPSSNSLEWFCAWADPSRFESARWLKTNSIGWRREKSHHGSEQRDQRMSAARRRLCENCLRAILPQLEGSLLLRAFNFEIGKEENT
jgi:hypothetical protein